MIGVMAAALVIMVALFMIAAYHLLKAYLLIRGGALEQARAYYLEHLGSKSEGQH
jgi:hypothetical protein